MRSRLALAGLALFVLASAAAGSRWWASAPVSPESPEAGETAEASETSATESGTPEASAERQQSVQVRRGDNLVAVLIRAGISPAAGHEVAAALRKAHASHGPYRRFTRQRNVAGNR